MRPLIPDQAPPELVHNGWHARFTLVGQRIEAVKGYMDGQDFIAVRFVGSYATAKAAERAARREMY